MLNNLENCSHFAETWKNFVYLEDCYSVSSQTCDVAQTSVDAQCSLPYPRCLSFTYKTSVGSLQNSPICSLQFAERLSGAWTHVWNMPECSTVDHSGTFQTWTLPYSRHRLDTIPHLCVHGLHCKLLTNILWPLVLLNHRGKYDHFCQNIEIFFSCLEAVILWDSKFIMWH